MSGTYTAEELAEYLRVHPYTVKRLAGLAKSQALKLVSSGDSMLRRQKIGKEIDAGQSL